MSFKFMNENKIDEVAKENENFFSGVIDINRMENFKAEKNLYYEWKREMKIGPMCKVK